MLNYYLTPISTVHVVLYIPFDMCTSRSSCYCDSPVISLISLIPSNHPDDPSLHSWDYPVDGGGISGVRPIQIALILVGPEIGLNRLKSSEPLLCRRQPNQRAAPLVQPIEAGRGPMATGENLLPLPLPIG